MYEVLKAAIDQLESGDREPTKIFIGYEYTIALFNQLTKESKWYHTIKIDRHHASRIMKKHREGTYTNYKWFFGKFGYNSIELIWRP